MRLLRLWRVLSSAALGLFLVVTFTPLVNWYAGVLAGPWNDPDGDTLIVLAGGDLAQGFPSEDTMLRCMYAVRAWRSSHFRKVVTAGYQTSETMRDLLACDGVPAASMAAENASHTTRENAVNVSRLLTGDTGSKVLLTSDFHMWRAIRVFRKAGLQVLPRPIPDARKRGQWLLKRWPVFQDEMVETVKIGYYFLRGWI